MAAFLLFPWVYRAVKLVTKKSSQVCLEERQNGYILSIIEAQRMQKPCNTKHFLGYMDNIELCDLNQAFPELFIIIDNKEAFQQN